MVLFLFLVLENKDIQNRDVRKYIIFLFDLLDVDDVLLQDENKFGFKLIFGFFFEVCGLKNVFFFSEFLQ